MNKRKKPKPTNTKIFTRNKMILAGATVSIILICLGAGYNSLKSTGNAFSFLNPPSNAFLKITSNENSRHAFVWQSSGSVKGLGGGANPGLNPKLSLHHGFPESIHIINLDYQTHSNHNFNIDEFNIHTGNFSYFQTKTVTFTPNKEGKFHYYCSIHPEMRGDIVVYK